LYGDICPNVSFVQLTPDLAENRQK
jgi:hypothetical protein